MEVIEGDIEVEEGMRGHKLHKKSVKINDEMEVNRSTKLSKQKRKASCGTQTECFTSLLDDTKDQEVNLTNIQKNKEAITTTLKHPRSLSHVMKLEERKDLLCSSPMADPLGPDTFENFQWVGIKQETLDDVELSKVVLTEIPFKTVGIEQESPPTDVLEEATLLSPLHAEDNDSAESVQTDREKNEQDSSFEESSSQEEDFSNSEEIILKSTRKRPLHDCDICGRKLSSKGSLRLHKLKKHKEKVQFTCELCGDRFDFQREVVKHRNSIHKEEDGRFSCGTCSKRFAEYHNLSVHMKNYHNISKVLEGSSKTCSYCHESFHNEQDLKTHLLLLHNTSEVNSRDKLKPQEKNFICDTCGKRFAFNCLLKDHTNLHTGNKPYLCQECGKSFAQKATLKQHAKTHNEIRPFRCPDCPMGFFNKGDLKKHLRKHTGERPFVCEVCGEAFSRSTHLGVHRRSHTGERPFTCDVCQRGFTKRGDVVRHRRIHTGELPYLCQLCGKAYRQSTQCANHIKNQHPGAPLLITKCTSNLHT